MKEIVLYLILLPWNHRPETRIEVERYETPGQCAAILKEHNIVEGMKYLLREPSSLDERKTPGKIIRTQYYGVMRLGYYKCTAEPPKNLQSQRISP